MKLLTLDERENLVVPLRWGPPQCGVGSMIGCGLIHDGFGYLGERLTTPLENHTEAVVDIYRTALVVNLPSDYHTIDYGEFNEHRHKILAYGIEEFPFQLKNRVLSFLIDFDIGKFETYDQPVFQTVLQILGTSEMAEAFEKWRR